MARSKTAPAWRRAFLRELARSGSVAMAARTCGIDRTTPYQWRNKNPAFAASWERALARGRESLAHPQPLPQAGGESSAQRVALAQAGGESSAQRVALAQAGGESAAQPVPLRQGSGVRGGTRLRDDEIVRSSKAGRPCIVRAGPGRWSAETERRFLAELTATANVKAAARAAEVSAVAAYNRRKLWPAFAEQWRIALAEGYVRIETLLIHQATATLDPEPEVAAREAPAMSVEQALALFRAHRASQQGGKPQRYGWRAQEPDIEEVRGEILRKLTALEKARATQASRAAMGGTTEAECGERRRSPHSGRPD